MLDRFFKLPIITQEALGPLNSNAEVINETRARIEDLRSAIHEYQRELNGLEQTLDALQRRREEILYSCRT